MGLANLFISHDIAIVERMSHRIAAMYLGGIVPLRERLWESAAPIFEEAYGGRANPLILRSFVRGNHPSWYGAPCSERTMYLRPSIRLEDIEQ